MTNNPTRRLIMSGAFGLGVVAADRSWASQGFASQPPGIEFVSNPLADYLHLLFFRPDKPRFERFDAPGFGEAPSWIICLLCQKPSQPLA